MQILLSATQIRPERNIHIRLPMRHDTFQYYTSQYKMILKRINFKTEGICSIWHIDMLNINMYHYAFLQYLLISSGVYGKRIR